jgi:hypothetical protein
MTFASRRLPLLAALTALTLSIGITAEARAAAPVGSDGLVHACYKTKGKGKGTIRVVKAGKQCKKKKGEKPLVWGVQGPSGSNGTPGTGSGVTHQNLFDLLALIQNQGQLIDTLTGQLDGLTDQLDALTGDVADLSGILDGISNADLNAVIASLPILDSVCSQLSTVTGQANSLLTVLDGLGLNGVLTALGGLLQVPNLPDALDPFSCPAP